MFGPPQSLIKCSPHSGCLPLHLNKATPTAGLKSVSFIRVRPIFRKVEQLFWVDCSYKHVASVKLNLIILLRCLSFVKPEVVSKSPGS